MKKKKYGSEKQEIVKLWEELEGIQDLIVKDEKIIDLRAELEELKEDIKKAKGDLNSINGSLLRLVKMIGFLGKRINQSHFGNNRFAEDSFDGDFLMGVN